MVKKRDKQEPWMTAPDYGRSLRGLSINLLVKDVARAIKVFNIDAEKANPIGV